jgi:hypothetical protein
MLIKRMFDRQMTDPTNMAFWSVDPMALPSYGYNGLRTLKTRWTPIIRHNPAKFILVGQDTVMEIGFLRMRGLSVSRIYHWYTGKSQAQKKYFPAFISILM